MTPRLDRPLRTREQAEADIAAKTADLTILYCGVSAPMDDCIARAQADVEGDDPVLASEGVDFLSMDTVCARIRQMADEQNAERG